MIDVIFNAIDGIKVGGGTTLLSGFNEANLILSNYIGSQNDVKNGNQNRIILLTDVGDNSCFSAKEFIEKVEMADIHTTIIGISDDFVSSTCEQMNEIKGFNYFCATEVADLKKYLFENFSSTFFPSCYDIEISIENPNIQEIEVFGTADAKRVKEYNNSFQTKGEKIIVTRSKTSFPSEIEIDEKGILKQYGGLIIIKLKLAEKQTKFDALVHVKYLTSYYKHGEKGYKISYEIPLEEQFFSDQSLSDAMSAFNYVFEVKHILEIMKSGNKKQTDYSKYAVSLEKIRDIVPKSKLEEHDKMIKAIQARIQ